MKAIMCFFLGHGPEIRIVWIYRYSGWGENQVLNEKAISASCWCKRCGNLIANTEEIL